jgi:hypothetical protein
MMEIVAVEGDAGAGMATQWHQIAIGHIGAVEQHVVKRGTVGGDPMQERDPVTAPHLHAALLEGRVVIRLRCQTVRPELHQRTSLK